MERLARELSLARAEITSLRGQCDELRLIVTNNDLRGGLEVPKSSAPLEDNGPPESVEATTARITWIGRPQSIWEGDHKDVDLTPTEADKPDVPHHSSSTAVGGRWDDIDNMSGDDARQALKSILSYFSLPPSSLRTLPPLYRHVGHERAMTFLVHADELVWKRVSLSNPRNAPRRTHSHTPLTSSSQSNSSVQAPGLSPIRKAGEQASSNPEAGGVAGNDPPNEQSTSIIFEENNVKALEDRLSLWERAVRTKMSKPKR
ncbi:hypothetical protein BS47DRAFT_557506 [Hydnum rufescens UP504]|uniref:Uncharacterized protein n=1 Tax=Hydnum rufescens UP504 TaxID=1448309 RepID=A0A9P6DWB4_9AGAM|nr:hypothetical protein BS47DRAFT_557506 [Hydnum rufescens UP504]